MPSLAVNEIGTAVSFAICIKTGELKRSFVPYTESQVTPITKKRRNAFPACVYVSIRARVAQFVGGRSKKTRSNKRQLIGVNVRQYSTPCASRPVFVHISWQQVRSVALFQTASDLRRLTNKDFLSSNP